MCPAMYLLLLSMEYTSVVAEEHSVHFRYPLYRYERLMAGNRLALGLLGNGLINDCLDTKDISNKRPS